MDHTTADLPDLDLGALLTAPQLVRYFDGHVSRNALGLWIRRGKLTAAGTRADGRPVYRLGDALAVEAATARSPRGRPRRTRRAAAGGGHGNNRHAE